MENENIMDFKSYVDSICQLCFTLWKIHDKHANILSAVGIQIRHAIFEAVKD